MPKQVTPKELTAVLKKLGFEQTRIKGSHHRFVHADGRKTSVPIHGNEPIGAGLLNKIIKQDLKMDKIKFMELIG
ncbi:MAG: type II toxin-antitoxin system HicA family toxin [Candidatus Diapherotrites archaeon]